MKTNVKKCVFSFFFTFLFLFSFKYQIVGADQLLPSNDSFSPPSDRPNRNSAISSDKNWTALLDDDGSSEVPGVYGSDDIVPAKYSFSPKLTSQTTYYLIDANGNETLQKSTNHNSNISAKGETKLRVTNIGYYQGTSVDIIYNILVPNKYNGNPTGSYTIYIPHISSSTTDNQYTTALSNFLQVRMGSVKSKEYVLNQVQFVKSGTTTPIKNISGVFTSNRLSAYKGMYIDPQSYQGARVAKGYGSSQRRIVYGIAPFNDNKSLFIASNTPTGDTEEPYNSFSELFTASDGTLNLLFYDYLTVMYYSVGATAVSPTEISSPDVIGNTNDNSDKKNNISWDVVQTFPAQPDNTYLDNYALHFKAPVDLDSSKMNLSVTDSSGKDVTSNFNLSHDDSGNYTATAKSQDALVNQQYTFTFTGTVSSDQLSNNDFLNKYLDTSSSNPYYIKMNGESYATYGLKGNSYTTTTDDGKATTSADSKMAINSYKVIPVLNGSMQNTTTKDGKNHVDDTMSFTWAAQNGNSDARWGELVFKVKIPDGLNIDLSSLKLKLGNNASYAVPSSKYSYDSSSRTLTVNSNSGSWIGTGSEILTYDTTIDGSARGSTISETDVSVGGIDQNVFVKPGDTKPTASTTYSSTPFDVEKDSFPSVPDFKKGVENATEASRGDGKNRINDVLNFTLTAQNKGKVKYSKWGPIIFKDVIPKGLNIDKDSLKLKLNDGTTQSPTNATYDKNSDGSTILTLDTTTNLSEGDSLTLSYNATIDPLAGDPSSGLSPLVNKASASGKDINGFADGNYGANITKTDSQTIAVEPNILKPKFTNQLKKDNDTDDSYSNTVTARYGETIDYKLIFKAEANGRSFKGGSFKGSLPKGLSLVSDGVDVNYSSDGSNVNYKNLDSITDLKQIDSGQSVTITFKVKITQETPSEIQYLPSILETDDDTPINANVSTIEPQDWLGFEEVPSDIDFGTHTPFSITNINNIKTVGNLNIMNYTNSPYYQISVSYDPLGDTAIKNGDNILQAVDSQGLLFIKQKDTGRWIPINSSGAMLNSAGFNKVGSNSLTEFVGPGKWLMNANGTNIKSGRYSGNITWSAIDGIPNN